MLLKMFCFRKLSLFNQLKVKHFYLSKLHFKGQRQSKSYSWQHKDDRKRQKLIIGAGSALLGSFAIYQYLTLNPVIAKSNPGLKPWEADQPGLPIYSSDEISKHNSSETGIWVSYQNGVYDITQFIKEHPGGEKILMAAGGGLEPFWELYAIHKNEKVFEIMETYRIGNLSLDDRGEALKNMEDPYASDPKRHNILNPSSKKPFNAEPPMDLLVESFITPNAIFFVRNHLPVPNIEESEYTLEILTADDTATVLTLDDLKKQFQKHTVISTLQCAGNRRSELNKVKEVKGLNWGGAAISTAEWGGAKLIDVLSFCGVDCENPGVEHVQFEGLDVDPANSPYGASIPAHKVFDATGDVILAYEMNGVELPRDHGYPVRVIVPGIVGARNVKWLGRIILSHEESESHWQQRDYKGFSPSVDWNNVDFSSSPAIQELPVTSAICQPAPLEKVTLENGKIAAKGYAWSGGGRKIVRVDVSSDGGLTWKTADLSHEKTPLHRTWSWTIWKVEIPLSVDQLKEGSVELICKAIDSSYNVQPETFAPIWNLRGVLGNAWHRVRVQI